MKNKKGIAWIKTILFFVLITLFTILVIFIMQYIKNANKNNLKANKNELKLIDNTEYNPIEDIYNYMIYGYKNSNFKTNSTDIIPNIFNYETNNEIYYYTYNENVYDYMFNNISSGMYPVTRELKKRDNKLILSPILEQSNSIVYNYGSTLGNVRSFAIGINSNVDVNKFNFTLYYNLPLSSTNNAYFYIYTDNGTMQTTLQISNTNPVVRFNGNTIFTTLPNATKVLRFGFAFQQSSNTTNLTNYLPQRSTNVTTTTGFNYCNSMALYDYILDNYISSEAQGDNLIYMLFDSTAYSQDYIDGYNTGYNEALLLDNEIINSLNNNIITLQQRIEELRDTTFNQQIIINNLQEQLNEQTSNFKGFFFTMADVPVRTISNILGFEVFGVNMFQFFIGIITALGCVWLIKKFI